MTSADVLPLCGHPNSPPRGWAVVSASSSPFADTTSQPNTTKVARVLMFSASGTVTVTCLDGSTPTFTLAVGWTYPVKIEGAFTHVTAISGPVVYAGFF